MTGSQVLLAVDGPSLMHRNYHALLSSGLRTSTGTPTWAIKGLCGQLVKAVHRTGADALIVGWDDVGNNQRKARWPHYKAKRPDRDDDLTEQLHLVERMFGDAGVHIARPAGLEADDVLASAVTAARAAGWKTIILTSDRDAFALIADDVRVLRLLTGGMEQSPTITAERMLAATGVRAGQYSDFAAFRGDASDCIPSVGGCGKITAQKLLAEMGSAEAIFADAAAGGRRIKALPGLGPALVDRLADPATRAAFADNIALMRMHGDLDVGLQLDDPAGAGRLPIAPRPLAAAIDALELASVRGLMLDALAAGWTPLAAPRPASGEPPPSPHRPDAPTPYPPPAPAPDPEPDPDSVLIRPGAEPEAARSYVPGSIAAAFPPPVPHPSVTSGLVDPYHCMSCAAPVRPHRHEIEHGGRVMCWPCCVKEQEQRDTKGRR